MEINYYHPQGLKSQTHCLGDSLHGAGGFYGHRQFQLAEWHRIPLIMRNPRVIKSQSSAARVTWALNHNHRGRPGAAVTG